MKNLKSLLCALFAAAFMAGCSADQLPDEPQPIPEGDGDGFFMSLDILMPNGGGVGSRSVTDPDGSSSGGTEVGADAENTVSS